MAALRQDVKNFVKTMADARMPVVNNWDVLCSYELRALNSILLKEYQKHPVNSRVEFRKTKYFVRTAGEVFCHLELGNPRLTFLTVQSGTYTLNIPLEEGSFCTQTLLGDSLRTPIPAGYNIVASGPILTVTGSGRDDNSGKTFDSNDVVEFGDQEQANIVLHFGKDLRNVKVTPPEASTLVKQLLEDITIEFSKNVKEVNYNIVQVVRNTTISKGLVLTPKTFIVTTMADENDLESGALSIWVQTNESRRPRGNPQPSFYPSTAVLPVPLGHTSSIIFSHQLVYEVYLKPALEKFYEVNSGDIIVDGNKHLDVLSLVPRNKPKQSFHLVSNGIEDRSYEYEIDYSKSPFQLYAYNDHLRWTWNFVTSIRNVETKVEDNAVLGSAVGAFFGPFYLLVATLGGGLTGKTLDTVRKNLKLTITMDKTVPFTSIDNTRFSAKVDLRKENLKVDVVITDVSGYSIFGKEKLNWEDIKTMLVPKLELTIFMPDIDFGTLDYFAEANILFNEDRFRMTQDGAIHFPYDTMVIGDIDVDERPKREVNAKLPKRHKREEHQMLTNSAGGLTSPINTAINWLSAGVSHLKWFNPMETINKIFFKSPQLISNTNKNCTFYPTTLGNFDHNSALILGDFAIRTLTKTKPYVPSKEPLDLLDAKAYAINIVEEFEEILSEGRGQTSDFDPVLLMSQLEKEVINGNHKTIKNILLDCIQEPKDNVKEKLDEMIEKQKDLFLQNHFGSRKNTFEDGNMDYFKFP